MIVENEIRWTEKRIYLLRCIFEFQQYYSWFELFLIWLKSEISLKDSSETRYFTRCSHNLCRSISIRLPPFPQLKKASLLTVSPTISAQSYEDRVWEVKKEVGTFKDQILWGSVLRFKSRRSWNEH